MKVEEFLQT